MSGSFQGDYLGFTTRNERVRNGVYNRANGSSKSASKVTEMPAEVLRCPACGAAASSESTQCEYCHAALATVACPKCFGMMFVGAKFCSHSGASAARTDVTSSDKRLCPRCRLDMSA